MNLVVISGCGLTDRHILGQVLARWPDATVIRPTWRYDDARDRFRRGVRSPVISSRRRVQRMLAHRRDAQIAGLLTDVPPKSAIAATRIRARDLNREEGLELLRAARPDVLVLSSSPILHDDILAIPTIGTINVHLGVAPRYRGEHTLFHALRRRDYDHVGLSIHRVDRGVDTGPLIVQAGPGLEPSDNEATVVAKCVALAAGLLVEQLELVERTGAIIGRPQTDAGMLYLRSDRRVFRHDLLDAVSRGLLRRRPPHRAGWVIRFAEPGLERA